ncbi:HAD hydrolase family protein [Tessaracoccus antarcticus]|uniref:Hydrolase n=1 Tax=Tessaracoccus antarcticus TaxID=2479848 RepID=A0A3M0GBR5_9ACTN|nr:HAD hydrolase family protein [Tessaracoccus antarcticus]RMB60002.1 hydrolase [Tessaracoccus antarcticus]
MRPTLVATDLDGTFLGAGSVAHPGNIAAARDIVEAGITLVIATGRPRRWLQQIDGLRELNPLVIASNGASVGPLCASEPDRIHPIPPSAITSFAAALPPELEPTFAVEYAVDWGREERYPSFAHDDEAAHIEDLAALVTRGEIIKVLARTEHLNTDDWAPITMDAAGSDLTCTFSWFDPHGTVELSATGVSKGTALSEILATLGIDPADCAAFGDMPNDLEMLQLVGAPFVMAGSHKSMFDHGFTTIGNHHEGAVGAQMRTYLV